jgi:peroxiredoxin
MADGLSKDRRCGRANSGLAPVRRVWQGFRMAEVKSTFMLRPGDPVPDFKLPDATGKLHSRAEAAGERGMLVVFACNHCPFVVHVAAALGDLAAELAEDGVGTVAINANDLGRYPQDGPGEMLEFAAKYGWDFPYLLDESQQTAKAFGAACTPDFFLIDADGCLFYAGQFDETRPRTVARAHGGDLREAARRLLAGENPPARPLPSSGCNIKWKPGNEPAT